MTDSGDLDRLYGLLIALGEDRREDPQPDLMDAFNLVATHHVPATLVSPTSSDYDSLLRLARTVLLKLAETTNELPEALDMYDASELVKSVIERRRNP